MTNLLDKKIIKNAVNSSIEELLIDDPFEVGFIKRNYKEGDLTPYIERLKGIGFENKGRILDSGCGYGQWTLALASLNKSVLGLDIEPVRIDFCKKISKKLYIRNTEYICDSMTNSQSKLENTFDGIFSYSSIALTSFKKTIEIYYSLLKPGGKLYLSCYDLGWMLYLIEHKHGENKHYDSREWAINCIQNTINYFANNKFEKLNSNDGIYLPKALVLEKLLSTNFEIISICGDGLTTNQDGIGKHPFAISEYDSYTAVYEIICKKRTENSYFTLDTF